MIGWTATYTREGRGGGGGEVEDPTNDDADNAGDKTVVVAGGLEKPTVHLAGIVPMKLHDADVDHLTSMIFVIGVNTSWQQQAVTPIVCPLDVYVTTIGIAP